MLRPLNILLLGFVLMLTLFQDAIPAQSSKQTISHDIDIETEIVQIRKRKILKTSITDTDVFKKSIFHTASLIFVNERLSSSVPLELDNNYSLSGAKIAQQRTTAG